MSSNKPEIDLLSNDLSQPVEQLLNRSRLRSGRLPENWRQWFPEILGNSRAVSQALEIIAKIAGSDGSVLISGESGTGKELVASAIHRVSARANNRFIAVNCSAIPEQLLESELFGHEKGAFTGADKRRTGLFESAEGGTVFLDEIGDMPFNLQSKLLRVLQERQFTPLGSNEIKKVDVRVIAATNIDLQQAIHEKKFRADLFYRLNVLPVVLPPLRDRLDDLESLSESFLKTANRIHGFEEPCYLGARVLGIMRQYPWPGNVRELQNVIERMVVIKGGGQISPEQLPKEIFGKRDSNPLDSIVQNMRPIDEPKTASDVSAHAALDDMSILPDSGIKLCEFIEDLENKLILQALERTDHNKNKAAKLLGLNRTTLVERIKKRKIAPLKPASR